MMARQYVSLGPCTGPDKQGTPVDFSEEKPQPLLFAKLLGGYSLMIFMICLHDHLSLFTHPQT